MVFSKLTFSEFFKAHSIDSFLLTGDDISHLQQGGLFDVIAKSGQMAIIRTPAEFRDFALIDKFGIIGNLDSAILSQMYDYDDLRGLWISVDNINQVQIEINKLNKLTSLFIINKSLLIPQELLELPNLTSLGLALNSEQLEILLTKGISKKIVWLDLSGNRLRILPPEICHFTNLRLLNISSNRLTTLPAEIGQLTNLIWLNLSDNQLSILPAEIGQLTELVGLDLARNNLKFLPSEIGDLRKLTNLNLGNFIPKVSPFIFDS